MEDRHVGSSSSSSSSGRRGGDKKRGGGVTFAEGMDGKKGKAAAKKRKVRTSFCKGTEEKAIVCGALRLCAHGLSLNFLSRCFCISCVHELVLTC